LFLVISFIHSSYIVHNRYSTQLTNKPIVMPNKVIIAGFRTRKEVAAIIGLSERSLYNLLSSEKFKDKIPKGEQLSPAHQVLIFEHCGIPYTFDYSENGNPSNKSDMDTTDNGENENKNNNR